MNIAFPFHLDSRGRTASATDEEHIRQMLEHLLFTSPGERINRPDFGTGLMQLVFAPNSPEIASATQFLVQGALQQYLGEYIQVESVEVRNREATLEIAIQYLVRSSHKRQTATFTREI